MARTNSPILILPLLVVALGLGAQAAHVYPDNGAQAAWVEGSPNQYPAVAMTTQDVLFFNWTGTHSVLRLPSATAYANCDFTQATSLTQYTGAMFGVQYSYSYFSTSVPGTYYFACGVSNHCSSQGMKVQAVVSAAPGSSPVVVPVSPTSPTSPVSPSAPSTPSPAPATTRTSGAVAAAAPLALAVALCTALIAALV